MNFGLPPSCTLMAGAGFDYVILPQGCDEVGSAGAVQGSPVRLVKARTVDALAVADAEVVLEGYVNPRDRRFETAESEKAGIQGRFHFDPEWAGYMGKAYKAPTFHVTAVTTRKRESKPIIFPLGVHTLDDHNIDTTVREASMFELCERMQPGIIMDVNIPYCMTDWGGAIIQVKKRNRIEEGWQRNFMAAILATSQGSRLVITGKRDFYRIRAAASLDTRLWQSEGSTAWTVVYEGDPRFQLSCLNRFVYVKGVSDLTQTLQNADSVWGKVSTVGLAAPEGRARPLATQLARWGVTRVCPLGRMQHPPLTWRHDGRPALGDLVRWTNWELV